ncbi:MAG: DUF5110 domain-containing protein [Trueperaceae bacterium]|nr:MAG: DUF5110 domain-containing protein [Trueperaceae bacterium]
MGQDIGGWDGDDGEEAAAPPPSPELYTRWFEIGVFNALTRAHGTSAREPYQFGQEVEQITKDYLRLRYRLLPYIYTSAWQASQTGVPLVRPLVLEFQNDPTTYVRDDEFLFGPSLLVAPVTTLGASSREVYLPEGLWYDFWEPTQTFRGPTTLTEVAAPLGRVPLFVRGGAVIPMGPEMNYVGEQPLDPLELHIYPDQTARGLLYEDDGVSPEGSYSTTNYNLIQGETLRLDVDRRTGLFRPQERTYRVILYDRDEPTAVARDGSRVAEVASHLELQTVSYGWFYDASARVLHLAFPDTGAATQWEVR